MPKFNIAKTQHMNNALYVIKSFVLLMKIVSPLKSSGLKS